MQLHQLKPIHKNKRRKRIGRGGKKGTYSGKGIKGQRSRAGAKFQPAIRELIKKYPKLRGYRFKTNSSELAIINIESIDKNFKENEKITPETLLNKRLIRRIKGKVPEVKILDRGEVKKPLSIENCLVSQQAREKIEKAGGQIKL
jgi:large subunit ribosomal protein L15